MFFADPLYIPGRMSHISYNSIDATAHGQTAPSTSKAVCTAVGVGLACFAGLTLLLGNNGGQQDLYAVPQTVSTIAASRAVGPAPGQALHRITGTRVASSVEARYVNDAVAETMPVSNEMSGVEWCVTEARGTVPMHCRRGD